MNTKRFIVGALTVVLLPLGLTMAQPAKGPGPGKMGRPHRPDGPGCCAGIVQMYDRITKALPCQLELTPEQLEEFNTLVSQNRAELNDIVKQLEAQRAKFDADLNAILTPQQQAKLNELKERKQRMMKESRQRMRPGKGEGKRRGMGPGPHADKPAPMLQAIEELNLSPERSAQVTEILKNSRQRIADAPKGDRQARMEIMKDTMAKLNEVLTPEEMEKVKESMRALRPKGPRGEKYPMGKGPGRPHRGMKGQGKCCPSQQMCPMAQPTDGSSESQQ
ncbi:MAG: hypothetical protein GX629_11410 [Phycisphaerae bacterium]|jgi:Spy/CpxP family protein refolding chaperone|nr:hypothetical protein [Phycisphaerae bacterium]